MRQPLSNHLYNDALQYGSFIVCFTVFTLLQWITTFRLRSAGLQLYRVMNIFHYKRR